MGTHVTLKFQGDVKGQSGNCVARNDIGLTSGTVPCYEGTPKSIGPKRDWIRKDTQYVHANSH